MLNLRSSCSLDLMPDHLKSITNCGVVLVPIADQPYLLMGFGFNPEIIFRQFSFRIDHIKTILLQENGVASSTIHYGVYDIGIVTASHRQKQLRRKLGNIFFKNLLCLGGSIIWSRAVPFGNTRCNTS